MKTSVLIVVVSVMLAQACASNQPASHASIPDVESKQSFIEAIDFAQRVSDPYLEFENLKPRVNVSKLTDWSACTDATKEVTERKNDRLDRAYATKEEHDRKLSDGFQKFRLHVTSFMKIEDETAYYHWLELIDRNDLEGLNRLRAESPVVYRCELELANHPWKRRRQARLERYDAVCASIEKVYRDEMKIINGAKKELLRKN